MSEGRRSRPEVRLGPGGEFDLIRRFLAPLPDDDVPSTSAAVRVGPGDDCAVVDDLAVSVDMVVEGVHFRREWLTPWEIGWRAAAAALSDLAAMAAEPVGVLASLALRAEDAREEGADMTAGIRAAAASVGARLLGGDLARTSGPAVLDVTVLGRAPAPVLRRGAAPGDELWVTGALGAAAAAVRSWRRGEEPSADARRAFARPLPRVAQARWLAERGLPRAMIDLSDGLAGDAAHLAAAGEVAVVVEAARVPVSSAASGEGDALDLALGGGEDYELCFAAAAGAVEPQKSAFERQFGLLLSRVGMVREGRGVYLLDDRGVESSLKVKGYSHFDDEGS